MEYLNTINGKRVKRDRKNMFKDDRKKMPLYMWSIMFSVEYSKTINMGYLNT
jgi:hypothetical protein